MIRIYESSYLYEIEIIKTKLASEGIESYIQNEYVNNVAVMPIKIIFYSWQSKMPSALKAL
ncbi:hypothetical protein [Riemerella columbina]|uniref:hypothetical protein n=1 Tax=Riemerella columbina TaxID=103810 RepID=UPI00349F9847